MDSSIIETLKLLLKDASSLSKRVSHLEQQSGDLEGNFNQLEGDFHRLEERLSCIEDSQPTGGAVPVGFPPPAQTDEEPHPLLDLPLTKIIDTYHEIPAILEPTCQRVALIPDLASETAILERNRQGNYWVLQLRSQGFFLLPRPGAFDRLAALESMSELFIAEGEVAGGRNREFVLRKPATLTLIKRKERWQLAEKGQLQFGESPLGFRWQQELDIIREQYRHFNTLLETLGRAGLETTLTAYRWLQSLERSYGNPVSIMIDTCAPIAYAIYKASDGKSILVPCNVIVSGTHAVLPAWDRGIDWESSIYAKFHSKDNRNVSRTRPDHSYLPNQLYLKELNWESTHTWAIANNYAEAAAIVAKLDGNWGSLDG